MRQLVFLVTAGMLAFGFSGVARAEQSARQLLEDYSSASEYRRSISYVSLLSMFGGMAWASAQVEAETGKGLFCRPDRLKLTAEQLVSIMRQYLKEQPGMIDHEAGLVLLIAVEDTFPCK